MKIKMSQLRNQSNEAYANFILEEYKKINYKRPVSGEQAPSTQAILNRPEEADYLHFQRALPNKDKAQVETNAEKLYALTFVNAEGRMESAKLAEEERRKSKNTIGDSVSQGGKSASEERKEIARQAFSFTPPAEITQSQKLHLVELNKIKKFEDEIKQEEIKKKTNLYEKMSKVADNFRIWKKRGK